jgi:hypothetical protein
MISIIILAMLILVFAAIILWVICFRMRKKQKRYKTVILAIIGLFLLFPPIYGTIKIFSLLTNEAVFSEEFTELNKEFSHIHSFNKIAVTGMYIEISGYVNGRGILSINLPNSSVRDYIVFELSGKINIDTLRDWYNSEFELVFLPENEFVEGNIKIRIKLI